MEYAKQLQKYRERRERIVWLYGIGKPRSVIARIMNISRQRVYQLTKPARPKRA